MADNRRSVPLCDLTRQAAELESEIMEAIRRVVLSGRYILGPECEAFEADFAKSVGTAHAIGCASGSDALLIALLSTGVGPGDEVIVPDYTFFATAAAVSRAGAIPVFVDVEPGYLTLDPSRIAARITPRTKAVLPVHLFGNAANLAELQALCDERGLLLIEDAAQALGATWDGRSVGTWGNAGCFSFFPTKNLGVFGDGGMLVTNQEDIATLARQIRVQGQTARHRHERIGLNSRLDALQAAILRVKLPHLPRFKQRRQEVFDRYALGLSSVAAAGWIQLPAPSPRCESAWNLYVLQVAEPHQNGLRDFLESAGIQTEIYYPLTLHQQPCYTGLREAAGGAYPVAERAARMSLAIPMFPELTPGEQEYVIEHVITFFDGQVP